MMKHNIILMAALTLMVWSCSSTDDEPRKPEEETSQDTTVVIQPANDERPAWQAPDYARYEQTMSVFLHLQSELVPYASSSDVLCATISGDVRGIANFDADNTGFVLIIAGDSSDEIISLSYYCDRLHRLFTLTNWASFDSAMAPMGTGGLYTPIFLWDTTTAED